MTERTINAMIRRSWPHYLLQFRADGQVWAKPRRAGATWGVLLTRSQHARLRLLFREGTL